MSSFVASHNLTLHAEWLKLKRTGMLWLCIGAAVFIPVINSLVTLFVNQFVISTGENAWPGFIKSNFTGFTGFFFPLFLVLMMVRIVYMEHASDTWKLMETQPVSRVALFLAKYEVAMLLSLLCLLGLLLFSLIGGFILQWSKPTLGFQKSSINWSEVGMALFRFWIASLGLIAAQYFLSLLIKSFAWPLSIGLIAIIAGSIFIAAGILYWFPYSALNLTGSSYSGSNTGAIFLYHELLSLLWMVLFLWLAYRLFIRKSFKRAFFSSMRTAALSIGVIVVFAMLFSWISKPSEQGRYSHTVLAGELLFEKPVETVIY